MNVRSNIMGLCELRRLSPLWNSGKDVLGGRCRRVTPVKIRRVLSNDRDSHPASVGRVGTQSSSELRSGAMSTGTSSAGVVLELKLLVGLTSVIPGHPYSTARPTDPYRYELVLDFRPVRD